METIVHCDLYLTRTPVILSSIKCCVSQQGDFVSRLNALRQRAWAIIRLPRPHIKPRIVHHCARDQIVQALSPFFVQYVIKVGMRLFKPSPQGVGQDHVHHHLYSIVLLLFPMGGGCFALLMHLEEYPPWKDFKQIATILYGMLILLCVDGACPTPHL